MKNNPIGVYLHFIDGLAAVDFVCPDCYKSYKDIIIGGINEPEKCECGCELKKVRFGGCSEDD